MTLIHVAKLSLATQKKNVGSRKIDGLPLNTYDMVLVKFLL